MKKSFIILISAAMVVLSACGQKLKEAQVPVATKTAFQKEYPGVQAGWVKEDSNYEANFKQDGQSISAIIDKNGTIVETETSIPVKELPEGIQSYMKEHYGSMKLKEAAKIVRPNGDVNYEAEVAHKDIVFDATGNFIREEKE